MTGLIDAQSGCVDGEIVLNCVKRRGVLLVACGQLGVLHPEIGFDQFAGGEELEDRDVPVGQPRAFAGRPKTRPIRRRWPRPMSRF